IPEVGILTNVAPNINDTSDANRAAEIVNSLGRLDVGQGAVVAQGICLGLESIQGTDAMLDFVASHRSGYSYNPDGGCGVLLKAPKPEQDLRVDLPTIGPETIRRPKARNPCSKLHETLSFSGMGAPRIPETATRSGPS
ncbi:MAG: LpxI family protein, partial [Paracoccaceae bacterium]